MLFQFYGYVVRSTAFHDLFLLRRWTPGPETAADFWMKQGAGIESFIVTRDGYPLGVFQTEHVRPDQVRLHFQAVCHRPKKILKAITRLVPLIEEALRLRGVTAIFFTSHSASMSEFMHRHHQYDQVGEETQDGQVMAKRFERR